MNSPEKKSLPESMDRLEMNPLPPEEFRTIRIGNRDIRLYVPDEERMQRAWSAKYKDRGDGFPYWSRIWPSALAICEWLDSHPDVYAGKTVVELGAGLGLPSLFVAPLASSVLVSDKDPDAVRYAQASVHHNRYGHLSCRQLDWLEAVAALNCDLLLLSDVNYEPAGFDSLQRAMRAYLNQGTVIVLATPHRLAAREFVTWMGPFIRTHDLIESMGQPISIYLLSG